MMLTTEIRWRENRFLDLTQFTSFWDGIFLNGSKVSDHRIPRLYWKAPNFSVFPFFMIFKASVSQFPLRECHLSDLFVIKGSLLSVNKIILYTKIIKLKMNQRMGSESLLDLKCGNFSTSLLWFLLLLLKSSVPMMWNCKIWHPNKGETGLSKFCKSSPQVIWRTEGGWLVHFLFFIYL